MLFIRKKIRSRRDVGLKCNFSFGKILFFCEIKKISGGFFSLARAKGAINVITFTSDNVM